MNERMDPIFSIVTPSFKMVNWLKLCAASIADQKGPTFEHIVQDAGTGQELDMWAQSQPELRCYQEPDRGMYDAINRGLKRARGQYLAYLNCDEQYLPGALQTVEQFFVSHPSIEVVFGDVILINPAGQALSYRRVVAPTRLHTILGHLGTPSCGTFFRRGVLDRNLFFDPELRSVGDAVWIDSLLAHKVPMGCIRKPIAVYTFTGSNDSESENPARELRRWRAEPGSPPAWLRPAAVLIHRVRKFLAGAYLPRRLKYAIYTMASPEQRVTFDVPLIHFGWPGATAPPVRYANEAQSSRCA